MPCHTYHLTSNWQLGGQSAEDSGQNLLSVNLDLKHILNQLIYPVLRKYGHQQSGLTVVN